MVNDEHGTTRIPEITWPDDETLLALIWEAGSYRRAAVRLGCKPTSIQSRLVTRGLSDRYRAGKAKRQIGPLAPTAEHDPVPALEQELKEARSALLGARGDDLREQRVIDALMRGIEARKPLYRAARSKPAKRHDHSFVLLWSDAHAGEVVDAAAVGGANTYDWDVMLRRHQELFTAVASYVEHRNYPLGRLYVAALGDALSGNIHDELKETNELPLAEATVQFGLDAADWLEQFVEIFPAVTFAGVVGNHARESRKPQSKRKYSNADWVCYRVMQQRLRKQRAITFEIPRAAKHPLMVYGRRLLLFHGDSVGPSTMVGVPWGGIIRHVDKLRNQYGTMGAPVDHFLCGHFHQANVVSGKRIIVNGSVVGTSEYGLERFGEGSAPEQVLLTFNRNHGLVDVSYLQLKAGLPK